MDFSELLKHGGHAVFSPNHQYLATNEKYRLFIRDAESLELLHIYTCLDVISHISWSPDSTHIMCAQYKRRVVQVWSVADESWTCKIDEGVAGLSHACWSPCGRYILTTTEFQLRMTIWSLCDQSVAYIKFPKFAGYGYDFSHDGRYLLVLERHDFRDSIGMYTCSNWLQIKHFPIETQDCDGIKWSPDDRVIACWDTCLDYHILIYSPDGRRLASYRAYEHALGIKSIAWSPSAQFLAIGSYDEIARIFNNVTWKSLVEYTHPTTVAGKSVVIYTEQSVRLTAYDKENKQPMDDTTSLTLTKQDETDVDASNDISFRQKLQALKQRSQALNLIKPNTTSTRSTSPKRKNSLKPTPTTTPNMTTTNNVGTTGPIEMTLPSKYVVSSTPLEVLQLKPDPEKPNPKLGVGLIEWSVGDRFLLTRNDNMPNTLWIWDTMKLQVISVLHHLDAIRHATWDPKRTRLALCTGNNKLYLWAPQGASIVDVPTQAGPFCVHSLQWNYDGNSILLMDKTKLSVCYMPPS